MGYNQIRGNMGKIIEHLKKEGKALAYTVIPVEGNSDVKKLFAITLLGVWSVLTVAAAFVLCDLSQIQTPYTILTAAVFLLFGRLWGIEYDRMFKMK